MSLARWYDKVDNSGFKSFNVIAGTLYEHYDEVLNFFTKRATMHLLNLLMQKSSNLGHSLEE